MAKTVLLIKSITKPGKREQVRRLWEQHLKGRVEQSQAQEFYMFCYDQQDADTFYLFEIYNDPAVLEQNAQAQWFQDYLREVVPLLEKSEVGVTTPVWAKGVLL